MICHLALILCLLNCKKFTNVHYLSGPIDAQFKTDAAAKRMVTGIYALMNLNGDFENGGLAFYPGLSADELNLFTSNKVKGELENNNILKTNQVIYRMWASCFKTLIQINTCIEGLSDNNSISPAVRNQLLGEAKLCRAFEYFYLVNLWGDVPILTSSDWKINQSLPRASENQVYKLIIEDLKDASSLMMADYASSEKSRPNKFAALALLARVYLYQRDWVNAENTANLVINAEKYTLLSDLNCVFLKNSSEAIWQIEPDAGYGATYEGRIFNGINATEFGEPDYYILSESFLNGFEQGDARKVHWLRSFILDGKIYGTPNKYKDAGYIGNTNIKEYLTVLRLAEQYLIRAEARANNDKIESAISDLNVIRRRAGSADGLNVMLPLSNSLNKEECLLAVEKERRVELFCEWGHRWLDLKRTGRSNAVIGTLKPLWKSSAQLFPIPYQEILLNPRLGQNPGY